MKRTTSLLLALGLTLALAVSGAGAASESARLETVRALGIMKGDARGNMDLDNSVTRAEFVTMMAAASPYRDSAGGGGASLFKDVKSGHWAVSYVKLAVEQSWMSGYTDGTFRPDKTITLEEGCTALLRLLGYGPDSFAGSYPAAQLNKSRSIGLLDDLSVSQGQALTRNHCVGLFYNLLLCKNSAGQVYGTALGYTVANGEVDYSALVSAGTKGPYVAESGGGLSLPFSASSATFYRDSALSDAQSVQQYDVYYYNENLHTVWVYSDKATGTLTAVSPNRSAPASVTVAGVSYPLEGSQAVYKLSSQGEFREGGLVTLLLGKDGGVVDVISALEREAVYYGVVVSSKKGASSGTTSTGNASAQSETQVACTDGVVRTFYHSGGTAAGRLVVVTSGEDGTRLSSMQTKRLSGAVNSAGTRFAGYDLAGDVEILDTDGEGGYARIYPSRLAGARLTEDDVRFYTLDAGGSIDRLILQEATGDTYDYVYFTSVDKQVTEGSSSGSYVYLQGGEQRSCSGSALYPVENGGGVVFYDGGAVKSMRQLKSVRLDRLGGLTAAAGNKTYPLSEDVQVYLADSTVGRRYYAAALSDLNAEDYSLTGWYDDLGCSAGGRVRIIIAAPRSADTD